MCHDIYWLNISEHIDVVYVSSWSLSTDIHIAHGLFHPYTYSASYGLFHPFHIYSLFHPYITSNIWFHSTVTYATVSFTRVCITHGLFQPYMTGTFPRIYAFRHIYTPFSKYQYMHLVSIHMSWHKHPADILCHMYSCIYLYPVIHTYISIYVFTLVFHRSISIIYMQTYIYTPFSKYHQNHLVYTCTITYIFPDMLSCVQPCIYILDLVTHI